MPCERHALQCKPAGKRAGTITVAFSFMSPVFFGLRSALAAARACIRVCRSQRAVLCQAGSRAWPLTRPAHARFALTLGLLAGHGLTLAQPAPPPTAVPAAAATQLERVTILGNYANGVGTSDAASAGTVTAKLLESRPALRTGEVLEFVPGVIVTQHSGDGKANQYFLRGFNLDHGTDFATFVDGMPVNARTHAHGQGYSDLNFLIPELVNRIDYRKGPYYADEGDFASAGAAHINLFGALPKGIASLSLGQHGYQRAVVANSAALGDGTLLYALEGAHNNGPWAVAEHAHRFNGQLRYSFGNEDQRSSITAMAYSAGWYATDQIPLRAVQRGQIDRFGAISPTDGGTTARYSLSYYTERKSDEDTVKFSAYAIHSRVDLLSDFTYFLDNPIDLDPSATHGDQFDQAEHRRTFGLAASRSVDTSLGGHGGSSTVGLQWRHDRLDPVGFYSAVDGLRQAVTQEATVRETSVGVYAENTTPWTPWFRSVLGLRYDRFDFDVTSSMPQNTGRVRDGLASPKGSAIFGPWHQTEYFVNYGRGYHSNDARGVTATLSPKDLLPVEAAPGLVRSKGAELGARTEIIGGLQSSLALWQLDLDSELVFSGDAGTTEASGATRRRGIEFSNHYIASSWLLFDADLSVSLARFSSDQGEAPHIGRHVPGSVNKVVSLGATVTDRGPWSGHVGLRYFGPRPLIEDNTQQSQATTLVYARIGYKVAKHTRLALDVFNLFDREASDIDYYYTSRLKGEPAEGVSDRHFHPTEPRSLRLTLSTGF